MKPCPPAPRAAKPPLPGGKSASGIFSANPNQTVWELPPRAQGLCREKRHPHTTTASGVPVYGYRYYLPYVGKWASRDPIETITGEMAEMLPEGASLYKFVGNNGMNRIDFLGQYLFPDYDPIFNDGQPPTGEDMNPCSAGCCSKMICRGCCAAFAGAAGTYCRQLKPVHAIAACIAAVAVLAGACLADCEFCESP